MSRKYIGFINCVMRFQNFDLPKGRFKTKTLHDSLHDAELGKESKAYIGTLLQMRARLPGLRISNKRTQHGTKY